MSIRKPAVVPVFLLEVVFINNQQNINNEISQQIMSQGIGHALKIAKSVGGYIAKRILSKLIVWLISILSPFLAAILFFLVIFGFIYFSIIILPRYISEESNSPGVIFNWGKEDVWKLNQDIELINKYRNMENDWVNQFRSFDTLAYQKPEGISGNGANDNANINDVWGSCMAVSLINPLTMPNNSKYDKFFNQKAKKYNIENSLLKAIAYVESSFNTKAVSPAGCMGLMQLSKAKIDEYGIKDPFDPEQNIDGGARYLSELLSKYNNHKEVSLAAYNAGPGEVEKYGGIPPYPETENYVKKVMALYGNRGFMAPTFNAGSNIVAEQEQVEPHRVPWALMAALDRVLGDPMVHGKHGFETVNRGRVTEPEKRFKELEPKLEWKEFELYYYHRWVVRWRDKDGVHTKTYIETYAHNIKLLTKAETYEANYSYTWDKEVIEKSDEGDESYTKIIVPELIKTERTGPYYEKLRNILEDSGLIKDSNLELVLRLAMNMDPNFNVDANLTSSMLEINIDTESKEYKGSTGELAWPLRGNISSPFGYRVHPFTGQYRFHSGIDIAVPIGTQVHSAGDGLVVFPGDNGDYGKCLIIDHGKYRTLYAHLASYSVRPGREVKRGYVIASSGNTGQSTGPHLHFEVRAGVKKTEFISPITVLK